MLRRAANNHLVPVVRFRLRAPTFIADDFLDGHFVTLCLALNRAHCAGVAFRSRSLNLTGTPPPHPARLPDARFPSHISSEGLRSAHPGLSASTSRIAFVACAPRPCLHGDARSRRGESLQDPGTSATGPCLPHERIPSCCAVSLLAPASPERSEHAAGFHSRRRAGHAATRYTRHPCPRGSLLRISYPPFERLHKLSPAPADAVLIDQHDYTVERE